VSKWSGALRFGTACAVYRGPVGAHAPHAHGALQFVAGLGEPVTIETDSGPRTGPAFVIRSGARHALAGHRRVLIVYADPLSREAAAMSSAVPGGGDVSAASQLLTHIDQDAPLAIVISGLAASSNPDIDPRFAAVLANVLSGPSSIGSASRACGVSQAWLQRNARRHLGVPLATWLVWRKLETACRSLTGGTPLAGAASAGGFADQAHFTRAARRMLGVTPSTVAALLSGDEQAEKP